MPVDVFLKLGDIKGESKDAKHQGEIDVLSWSWGMSHTGASAGSGAGAGKAIFNDLTFTQAVDRATPLLIKACASGEHLKEATLVARKAGKGQQDYLIIKMSDILVTSVQASGTDDQPVAAVSLNFAKIDFEYKLPRGDGDPVGGTRFAWDLKASKPV